MIDAIPAPSPNFNARKAPADMLLLHYTGMASGEAALARMRDPASEVSAHYLVEENGRIFALVDEAHRAWHAGLARWAGESDINSCAIGVEIVNGGHEHGLPDYPPAQIAAVIRLCRDIAGRHAIPAHRVLAHSDVAPARKEDPGEKFPWDDLVQAGVGLPVFSHLGEVLAQRGDEAEIVIKSRQKLRNFGYNIKAGAVFDETLECVLIAFQRHFRQARIDGVLDEGSFYAIMALPD